MKTLYRLHLSQARAISYRNELERQTGVKWDWYDVGAGTRFTAVARTGFASTDEDAAQRLLPFLDDKRRSFESVWEASDLDWPTVVNGAWTLIQSRRAFGDVNRNGYLASVGLK